LSTTVPDARVRPSEYHRLSTEELEAELIETCALLSGCYTELSQVKVQYRWLFLSGYKASQETSVAGRDRSGHIAAVAIEEDEITLQGKIDSLTVLRDLILSLLARRA
jgi:hypothetical protein